jgi:isoquinoline 1-oxidoreductase alpha subunit
MCAAVIEIKEITPAALCKKYSPISLTLINIKIFHAKPFSVPSNQQSKSNLMAVYTLNINGKPQKVDVAADTPLLWVLRDHLGLVGTKYGCGIAMCGACTVHQDGNAVRSCMLPETAIAAAKITTKEGLSKYGDNPLKKTRDEEYDAKCGYCQAGQIMTAAALLKKTPKPTLEQIDNAMYGNICRCGTYHRIREAIQTASKKI